MKMPTETERDLERRLSITLNGIEMAMGCLDPLSQNRDERLGWYRLNSALKGESPKARLEEYET